MTDDGTDIADQSVDDSTELKRGIEDLDFQGETAALRRISEFSRQTLNEQMDSLDDIDSKAISILRINVILIGLILTAASFAADSEVLQLTAFANWQFILGIGSLVISSGIAVITYSASTSEIGIEPGKIDEAIQSDLTEQEFELAVAWSHRR